MAHVSVADPTGLVLSHGVFGRPFAGEHRSGDATWIVEREDGGVRAALLDVAGHGPEASRVVDRIRASGIVAAAPDPVALGRGLHALLRGHRGAALAILDLDPRTGESVWLAVGGIHARILGAASSGVRVQPGLVGEHLPNLVPTRYRVRPGDTLVLASDGISARGLDGLDPRALYAAPTQLARSIVTHHGRAHDDATCLVISVLR